MSRRTGPRVRAMRALGVALPGLSGKSYERRPYPPGQHGQARRKLSEYGLRLQEKQKLCRNYGVTETQLRRLMVAARKVTGPSGEKLLELLERRLDNVVFRAGFARTIPAARQLVNHGHVTVDGQPVDIPSYCTREGQVIALRERSRTLTCVEGALQTPRSLGADWLAVDASAKTATLKALPNRPSVPFTVNEQLVVEFYAQRV
jgi:small subunit ribosomal protein S4